MEISIHIIEQAKALLLSKVELPVEIKGAPGFFLSVNNDDTIHAFGFVEVEGIYFKIGVLKK